MKKISKYGFWMMMLVCVMTLGLYSCSDDEVGMGQPEITGVRVCDPAKADSLFTKSGQGQTIAIIGKNLSQITALYINDQKVYFSPTMNTDHSVIVTVPTEKNGFQLTAFNPELKDEIRIETTHGSCTYAFRITGSYPSIRRIQAPYPREAGDILRIFGTNLYDIDRIVFTDLSAEELNQVALKDEVPGNIVEASDYKIVVMDRHLNTNQTYEVTSELQLTIPSLPYDAGCMVIQCAAGYSYIPYSKLPGVPAITAISSDMPIVGTDLVIEGREFVQVESVSYGDVVLGADDFEVAESEDMITIHFTQKPAAGSGTVLEVKTPGGVAQEPYFFVRESLLVGFEPGVETDNGWGPNGELMTAASEASIPYVSDGQFFHIKASDGAWNWWNTMCYYRKDWNGSFPLPSFDIIPADAPAENIYLAMEIWDNNTGWDQIENPAFVHYQIQTDGDAKTLVYENFIQDAVEYKETPLRAMDGSQPQEIWYRHVLSLDHFADWAGLTYADIVADGINQIRLMHMNWTGTPSSMDIYIDNIRLYYKAE